MSKKRLLIYGNGLDSEISKRICKVKNEEEGVFSIISVWTEILEHDYWDEIGIKDFEKNEILLPYMKHLRDVNNSQFEVTHNEILDFLFSYLMNYDEEDVATLFKKIEETSIQIITKKVNRYRELFDGYDWDKNWRLSLGDDKDVLKVKEWLECFNKTSITTNYWSAHSCIIDAAESKHINGKIRKSPTTYTTCQDKALQHMKELSMQSSISSKDKKEYSSLVNNFEEQVIKAKYSDDKIYFDHYVDSGDLNFHKTKDSLHELDYKSLGKKDRINYENISNKMTEIKSLIHTNKPEIIEIHGLNPFGDLWLFNVLNKCLSRNDLFREEKEEPIKIIFWVYDADNYLWKKIVKKIMSIFPTHLNNIAFVPTCFFLKDTHMIALENNTNVYWKWAYKISKHFLEWKFKVVTQEIQKMTLQSYHSMTKNELEKRYLIFTEIPDSRIASSYKYSGRRNMFFNLWYYALRFSDEKGIYITDLAINEGEINDKDDHFNQIGIPIKTPRTFEIFKQIYSKTEKENEEKTEEEGEGTVLFIVGGSTRKTTLKYMVKHHSLKKEYSVIMIKENNKLI